MATTPRQRVAWIIGILVVVLYALIPVVWIASLSLKTTATIGDKHFFPQSISFDNYKTLFQTDEFNRALINSIGIALISTVIAVVLASMAAYALSRLDFAGHTIILSRALAGRLRGQGDLPPRGAGGGVVPADLDRRLTLQPVAQPRPVRHVGGPDH